MNGIQTGGVAFILAFLDELIRSGYTGKGNALVAARNEGRAYLRDVLLPAWFANDTWGRNYWDWEDPVQAENVTEFAAVYMMDNKEIFPNWKNDVRNLLTLFLNHTSVSPGSNGNVFSGAWAYPESSGCCGRSLWYGSMEVASVWARYGVEADSEWAREIARRSQILATYDELENGRSMDLINGGSFVNDKWFKIAHPMALDYVLRTMAWLPEIMGANRENHILRTSEVVRKVIYGKDKITYTTADAPPRSVDVLRLAYSPKLVTANGKPLPLRFDLATNGYTVRSLAGGDFMISIRHDGATELSVSGSDPQEMVDDQKINFEGGWNLSPDQEDYAGGSHVSSRPGASVTFEFNGNQVRLVGRVGRTGGRADVIVDGTQQLVPIDCFSPVTLHQQILYYRNGLANGPHTIKIVVSGKRNPASEGEDVFVDGIQFSAATGESGFGEGGGPKGFQRMVFGYPGREEYRDSQGNPWQPGTEFTVRSGNLTDSVAKTWWTMRQAVFVDKTQDPELYRYGVHWPDFTVNLTVAPGVYHLRLKFAETQYKGPGQRGITIFVNGQAMTEGLDVWATAGGMNKALDVVYNDIHPQNGVVAIRFVGSRVNGCQQEAMVQALEIGPGEGGEGSTPKTISSSHSREGLEQNQNVTKPAFAAVQPLRPGPSLLQNSTLLFSIERIPEIQPGLVRQRHGFHLVPELDDPWCFLAVGGPLWQTLSRWDHPWWRTSITAPLSPMARWNSPLAKGDAIRQLTAMEPADSPKIVTRCGSPPKAAMLLCTHWRAAIMSSRP